MDQELQDAGGEWDDEIAIKEAEAARKKREQEGSKGGGSSGGGSRGGDSAGTGDGGSFSERAGGECCDCACRCGCSLTAAACPGDGIASYQPFGSPVSSSTGGGASFLSFLYAALRSRCSRLRARRLRKLCTTSSMPATAAAGRPDGGKSRGRSSTLNPSLITSSSSSRTSSAEFSHSQSSSSSIHTCTARARPSG